LRDAAYRKSRWQYNGMRKGERGVCILSIEEMKNVDIRTVKRGELADIRGAEVNKNKGFWHIGCCWNPLSA